MALAEKLLSILTSKNNIKTQLVAKGVDMTDVPFSGYADKIASIQTGGGSPDASFTSKEFKSFKEAEELEYINVRGALLWTKDGVTEGQDGYLLASNGDSSEAGYWNPSSSTVSTPSKSGYTLIGVCLGNGYWARVGYAGLTTTKYWCQSSDGAKTFLEGACYHSGYEITKFMVNAKNYSTDSIWGLRDADSMKDHIYIPNWAELIQVCNLACDGGAHTSGHTFNKNLGKLLSLEQYNYWSGSQYPYPDISLIAFYVNFSDGNAYGDNKDDSECRSLALFHFGAV